MQLPDVRVSFLGVMTALAAGPKGSRFILAQFRQNASKAELEHFTWRKLFATIVAYCRCGIWVCFCRRYKELERKALSDGSVLPTGLPACYILSRYCCPASTPLTTSPALHCTACFPFKAVRGA
jgi:hypothetical protein